MWVYIVHNRNCVFGAYANEEDANKEADKINSIPGWESHVSVTSTEIRE